MRTFVRNRMTIDLARLTIDHRDNTPYSRCDSISLSVHEKGVFDEDCPPPELAERRGLQIAVLIGLEFPDDQTASIWDRLRPTNRSGMPRLDGFRKPADRF
ncbi:hypothetical protein D3C71_1882340 [compost metagenome]